MKKYIYVLLALLVLGGVAYATTVPDATEPKEGGPNLWLESVYNNAGATLDVGDVVIWDVDASTGDNDNWVTTTTTADTYQVAGVVYPADIAAGASGSIAIKGPVQVDAIASHLGVVKGLACTSTTAGSAKDCAGTLGPPANFGQVTQVNAGTSAIVCVNCSK